jgi:tetratricopeptide (TPR) repeat protein
MATSARERDQLEQLGLAPGATAEQATKAHGALKAFLASAPTSARPWARSRMSDVDAAYAAFIRDLDGGTSVGPAAVAQTPYIASDAEDPEELFDALDDSAAVTDRAPGPRRSRPAREVEPNRLSGMSRPSIRQGGALRRLALGVGGIAIVLVAVVVVYKLGDSALPGITGSPAPAESASAIDQAQVLLLMNKLADDPKDVATLEDLANLYYGAGDFASARKWFEQILAIDAKNTAALLGSGAAAFNLGDNVAAEKAWRAVLVIDTRNAEAHYDLGFMYLSKDPPELDKVRAEWNAVIAIDPTSEIAQTIATHLKSLGTTGSPGPSSSPGAGSPTPAASPAPSAQPSPG